MGTQSAETKRIVVGLDTSPEAADALEWARMVAGPDDSIVALRAWKVPPLVTSIVPTAADKAAFETLVANELAHALAELGDDRVVPMHPPGHAGKAIVEAAADADLVVVGHRGDSNVAMLGSTANYLLHHAPCPVAVVRGAHRPFATRRVVVGVDVPPSDECASDDESVRALQWAYRIPDVEQITVLHGWFLPPLEVTTYESWAKEAEVVDAVVRVELDRTIEAAGAPPDGASVRSEVVRSAAASALIDASADADLVVVGSRGRGGFAGLLLGSTSATVAAHSHAPVVVVRRENSAGG